MSEQLGRNVIVEFALAAETADPTSLTFYELGAMRAKSFGAAWDTIDTTHDKSPAQTKQNLTTFKSGTFSGDGISDPDTVFNQRLLHNHVLLPPDALGNVPKVWWRVTIPGYMKYLMPAIVSKFDITGNYDDAVKWTMESSSNGAIVPVNL